MSEPTRISEVRIPASVETQAEVIASSDQSTTPGLISIGRALLLIKGTLPQGAFVPWRDAHVPLSRKQCEDIIRVGLAFGECSTEVERLPPRVVVHLARLPPKRRGEALKASRQAAEMIAWQVDFTPALRRSLEHCDGEAMRAFVLTKLSEVSAGLNEQELENFGSRSRSS